MVITLVTFNPKTSEVLINSHHFVFVINIEGGKIVGNVRELINLEDWFAPLLVAGEKDSSSEEWNEKSREKIGMMVKLNEI